ncbi:hypothetical protein BFP72_03870 [Reichenbachiella sp. 5M10]|uniref:hypothetical protein n=1 Tax=Reichenbachiella sp. 5M10 TaxID=1889772 RepID=UPI000C159F1E|nr:hypothetical protein [Reichenbachiella sp. 5M10]PIB34606.1 hypothetical protein BFP72_03870 [Reichenbachiella sp. 5M10]
MKDRLEKWVVEHRNDFDDLEPRSDLWDRIAGDMEKRNAESIPLKKYAWVWQAAAVVFVCVTLGLLVERSLKQPIDVAGPVEVEQEDIQEVERYYTALIQERKAEIRLVMSQSDVMDEQLLDDLDDLDLMYAELKKDLAKNQNNEKLIHAMIRNLQLRVEILNKQLKILDQLIKYENDENITI